MAASANEAISLAMELLSEWNTAASHRSNAHELMADSVELIPSPPQWPFAKVTLRDGSYVCFNVMCVGK